ncbi:protein FAM98B-like [Vanessa cardui]|uniref:protein FAM98B-like n=1 Tax=Vanessa cardui TaxID=171605 RepID=UPI001F13F484|nr:protein FAM98B-like [Vanessa cardui]
MADFENIRRVRSPGGSGWQGSNFGQQSGGLSRSAGGWNSASGFGRSTGGWGNSDSYGGRSAGYRSNGHNSNGFSSRSGYGSENIRNSNAWDDSGVDAYSTW